MRTMTPADETIEGGDPPMDAREHGTRPPAPAGPGWIGRRARNVRRRPMLASAVGGAVFVTALLVTVIVPGAVDRAAATPPSPIRERPDTLAILRHVRDASEAARRADAALAAAVAARADDRRAAVHGPRSRADSLADAIATLDRLDSLLDRAPLPSSYRALGGAWPMRSDPRVPALLDSLDHLERRRAALDAGVDSSYVAFTARATALGRALRAIARARRAALTRELGEAAAATAAPWGADSAVLQRSRDSVHAVLASARRWLTQARVVDAERDARAARERARAARAAAIPAALVASAVVGIVVGFALAFAVEVRDPRVADVLEAEALVGAPVVARIPRRRALPPRRRAADREVPPLIEAAGGAYDALHDRLGHRAFDLGLVAVTGDDPAATAQVAVNLAATAARRVRSTIVVDADFEGASAARAARSCAAPGLADVLDGRTEWAAAAKAITVGRGRTMEMLPPGAYHGGGGADTAQAARADPTPLLLRLRRRHDAVVINAPHSGGADVGALARMADCTLVVVCTARTSTAALSELVSSLHSSGARIEGVVLWEGEVPPISGTRVAQGAPDLSVTATD